MGDQRALGGLAGAVVVPDDGDQVITYVEVEHPQRWHAGMARPFMRRWWRRMAEVMPTDPDLFLFFPPLNEVFHQD
jgi:L-rhamnose mutarotase